MHKLGVAEDILDRVEKRRGRRHIYDRPVPAKTALLVIDMQNTFMAEGAPAEVPVAREIVPNINRLAAALRRAGGTVVWIQMTMTAGDEGGWSRFFGEVNTPERSKRMFEGLSEGNEGWQFWPTLDIQNNDLVVRKNRYSCFLPGTSELPDLLAARGIDMVLITGTLTNVCCESSARDAMMRNFKVAMVSDANAALTDRDHQAALDQHLFRVRRRADHRRGAGRARGRRRRRAERRGVGRPTEPRRRPGVAGTAPHGDTTMLRSLLVAIAVSLPLAAASAAIDRGAAPGTPTSPPKTVGTQIAESAAQCRAKCEGLRAGCTGSQCRAAYAACVASCR